MTSFPALAIDPSDAHTAAISVWVDRADPRIVALISEALGSEASIVEVDVGQLLQQRATTFGPSVLVCDTRRADLARTIAAVARQPVPVPVIALCGDDDSHAAAAHLRAGAYDCLTLGVSKNLLAASIHRAAAHHQLMNEFHELEQRANDELEPKRKQKPDAGKQLPNGRWLHNVLPLDPSIKTSEHSSLSLGGDSDVDHDVVEPSLSPEQHLRQGHRLGEAKADFERRYLQAALAKCRGNLAAAARCSGMDRSNFRRLLKRYGLHPGSVERA